MTTCSHLASLINHQILFSKLQSLHKLHYNSKCQIDHHFEIRWEESTS